MSHLLYTLVLDDNKDEERIKGISLNLEMVKRCNILAVYTDYGLSPGMVQAIRTALDKRIPIEYSEILKDNKNA